MAKVGLDAAGTLAGQIVSGLFVSVISSEHYKPEGLLFATKIWLVGHLAPGICLSLNHNDHNAVIISMCSHGIFLLHGCRRLDSCSYAYHTTIVLAELF